MSSFSPSRDVIKKGADNMSVIHEEQIKRRLLERLHWIAEDLLREEEEEGCQRQGR